MNVEDLDRLYETYRFSVARLETRPHYSVPDDGPRLEAWRAGRPLPPRPGKERWLAEVREMVAAGKRVERVHVVDLPLSDYQRYELDVYAENVAAGERVLIVPRTADQILAGFTRDFLIFDVGADPTLAIWFDYNDDGRLLGYERATDDEMQHCRWQWDFAKARAMDLEQFVTATA